MTRPSAPAGAPPHPAPSLPSLRLPPGACDAHVHVFGPFDRFPLPPDRSYTPHEATEDALRRLHDHLGFGRSVLVQSQGHGRDHRPLLAALAAGGGRYRGVALVDPDTPAAELAAFAAAGVCGARLNFMTHLGPPPDPSRVRAVAELVRDQGWHLAIHVAGTGLIEHEALIRSLAVPVVIDHMGRPDIATGPAGPPMAALRRLLDTGRVWVKLSGVDRLSEIGAPYADAAAYAAAIASHAPERVLWGTDWPHVNLHGPMPDDGVLVDTIATIAPTKAARRAMLVDNPARFFGFPPLTDGHESER